MNKSVKIHLPINHVTDQTRLLLPTFFQRSSNVANSDVEAASIRYGSSISTPPVITVI